VEVANTKRDAHALVDDRIRQHAIEAKHEKREHKDETEAHANDLYNGNVEPKVSLSVNRAAYVDVVEVTQAQHDAALCTLGLQPAQETREAEPGRDRSVKIPLPRKLM